MSHTHIGTWRGMSPVPRTECITSTLSTSTICKGWWQSSILTVTIFSKPRRGRSRSALQPIFIQKPDWSSNILTKSCICISWLLINTSN
uniref:Uncharacterized protein n=1 Tax=Arundo donax TaxID=35708 RepID=A0A0A9D4B9_ARUDO